MNTKSIFILAALLTILSFSNRGFAEAQPIMDSTDEPASVEDSSEPLSRAQALRSNPNDKFWIGANAGLDGNLSTAAAPGGTVGTQTDVNLPYQFGRCGVMVDWHVQQLQYSDPADIRNSIFGVGPACTVVRFGQRRKFWRGAHLQARALLQQGTSAYHIYQLHDFEPHLAEVSNGTASGWGTSLGAQFLFPLFVGFWGSVGSNLEWMDFKYKVPSANADLVTNATTFKLAPLCGYGDGHRMELSDSSTQESKFRILDQAKIMIYGVQSDM